MQEQTVTTEQASPQPQNQETVQSPKGAAKPRKKRAPFKVPGKFPVPVKALWEAASEEEREMAHRTAVALLQVWLGQISREEAAKQLEVTPLRIWQLSQQGISGMLSGLLTQPKSRKGAKSLLELSSHKAMEKRLNEMEVQLRIQQELIDILKSFPAYKAQGRPSPGKGKKKSVPKTAPAPKAVAKESSPSEGGKARGV